MLPQSLYSSYKFLSQHLSLLCDDLFTSHPPLMDVTSSSTQWAPGVCRVDKCLQLHGHIVARGRQKGLCGRDVPVSPASTSPPSHRPLQICFSPLDGGLPSQGCSIHLLDLVSRSCCQTTSDPPFYNLITIDLISSAHFLPFLHSLLRFVTLVKSWGRSDASNLFGRMF